MTVLKRNIIAFHRTISLALLLVINVGVGEIIPSDRRIDWAHNVGIPGGIPYRSAIYTNISAGASLAAVQAAVNACPSNQVVLLAAGSYKWTNALSLANGVTLRGAGMNSTIIETSTGGTGNGGIVFASDVLNANPKVIPLLSGYTKDSTNLVLATNDVASLHAGYCIVVDQLNDNFFVNNYGVGSPTSPRLDTTPEGDGLRSLAQTVELKAITNGTNLTIFPPMYWTYTNSLSPQVYYRPASSATRNYLVYSGLEDLCVSNTAVGGNCLALNRAAYCWVKNVKTVNGGVYHMTLLRAFRCEIRHNTCTGSLNTTSANGYGIDLDYQSAANLIEDNIVANNRDFIKINSGSSGNVIAYNYMTNSVANTDVPAFSVHAGGHHSAHPIMNLWEGNVGYEWVSDFYWGSVSHSTLLRNWFRGPMPYASQRGSAMTVDTTNTCFNIVGNVLGRSSLSTNSNWTTKSSLKISPAVNLYQYDYATFRIGYYSDGDSGTNNSVPVTGLNGTNQWYTHIVAGNYDYVTGAQAWYNPTTPQTISNSYFYASKPSYFGSLTWPPIDPGTPSVGETVIPAGYRYAYGVDPPGVTGSIPGQTLLDFETGNEGNVVTAATMTNSTRGQTWQGWFTTDNPNAGTQGATPYLTITTNASRQLYTPANINGTTYSGSGTRGMRATMTTNNAVQVNFAAPGFQNLSLGFYFRFSGASINSSPRDLVVMLDGIGNYNLFQVYDQPANPYFHCHFQGGAGVGNNVTFQRSNWYWVTVKYAVSNAVMQINFYDTTNNYALLGSSTGAVASATSRCKILQLGCIKYASGGSQSVDYDNFIINTNGVFPLGPGAGGFPTNQPPVAIASATPTNGIPPLTVAFSSAGSSDPEGAALTYSWTFGDGATSTAANPSHTYQSVGNYFTQLTVSDGSSSTASGNLAITVSAAVITNRPPVAVAGAAPASGVAPLSVSFSSAGSSDPEGAALAYNWTFGDGATSTTANPSHTFLSAGNYSAQLTVSDGTNSAASSNLTITVGSLGPVAAYGFDETSGSGVTDASGNTNTGTINGATRVQGKFGKALAFDGTNAVVTVNDSPSLDLTTALTLEAWVNPTLINGDYQSVISKPMDAAFSAISYALHGASRPNGLPLLGLAGSTTNLSAAALLPTNAWSHLVGTYDGSTMRLYVNGVQVASQPHAGAITTSTQPLSIGLGWAGLIDEVRIYDRALNASEIQTDMVTPVATRPLAPNNLHIVVGP